MTKKVLFDADTLVVDGLDADRYVGYALDFTVPDVIPAAIADGGVIKVFYVADVCYDVVYLLNGGINVAGNPSSYAAGELPCSIGAPARSGYSFVGWTVVYSNGQPGVSVPTVAYSIPVGTSGTVALTAHWLKNDPVVAYASVVYDGNGFTGGSVPVDVCSPYVVGSSVTVLGCGSLVCEGYAFLGWALTSDADVPAYVLGSTFTILGDTVLFAVWEPVPAVFTVTYLPGSHGTFAEQVTGGLSYGVSTPEAPVVTGEAGWKFIGWSPIPSAVVTENAVYTAQWEREVFTVRFVDWDNTVIKEVQVAYGGSAVAPVNPARNGYTFIGWSSAFGNVVSDLTVTAQYSQNGGGSSITSSKPAQSPSLSAKPPASPVQSEPEAEPIVTPPPETISSDPVPIWALVNLILSVIGVVLAVLLTVYVLLQKKKKTDQKKNMKGSYVEEYTEEQKKRLTLWLLVTVALGIAGIIVFLLTEDMSRKMALVDKWTIINVIIFAVEIIAIVIHARTQKSKNKQASKQKMPEAQK